MADTRSISASQRADISRKATQRAFIREMLTAAILARLWPSYLTTPRYENAEYPALLCVESPAGLLVWRVSADELPTFGWLKPRVRTTEDAKDRIPTLQALADGW